jgi:hypothetical protein
MHRRDWRRTPNRIHSRPLPSSVVQVRQRRRFVEYDTLPLASEAVSYLGWPQE